MTLISVILIHAAQHYACFLEFEISEDYLNDFESAAPVHFINVNSTPWLDLSSKNGRERFVLNMCGMMRWARRS